MKALIIAEKPSVAGDIAAALGGFVKAGGNYERADLIITAAHGHLISMDSANPTEKWELANLPIIPQPFALTVIPGSENAIRTITTLANRNDVSSIINACDAGREGEWIFSLIIEYIGIKKPIERIWPQSMTPAALVLAFESRYPASQKAGLEAAARSRAESDWLVGVNITRALTRSNVVARDTLVSAGRVQTPTLAMVVDRENAILNFAPAKFYDVEASFCQKDDEGIDILCDWTAKLVDVETGKLLRFDSQAECLDATDEDWQESEDILPVVDEATTTFKKAPLLFSLTSLQRYANEKFEFSAARTLELAQALYEKHKVLTYPRTESAYLPDDYADTVLATLAALPGAYAPLADKVLSNAWVIPSHRLFDGSKVTDHFAIVPNGAIPASLDADEAALYNAVVLRFIAGFYPAAQIAVTTRTVMVQSLCFRTSGRVLKDAGWQAVYGGDAGDEDDDKDSGKAPPLAALCGAFCYSNALTSIERTTTPPSRFTDSTLLGAMQHAGRVVADEVFSDAISECGLGTPATRAATIEDLLSIQKGYLVRAKKFLVPSEKAMRLISVLRTLGVDLLTRPDLTGEWESRLALVEKGSLSRSVFMSGIVDSVESFCAIFKANAVSSDVATDVDCVCGASVLFDTKWSYKCPSCELAISKEIAGKKIVLGAVRDLVGKGRTKLMPGFISKAKKPFNASLVLVGNKVEFEFEARVAAKAPV